jgi:alkylation response protein AidB-like acyl-CoA dehydrogenase
MTSNTDDQIILDSIAKWLARDVAPHAMRMEHDDTYPTDMVAQMKDLGLFGAVIAPAWGGLGLSASLYARIVTMISEEWMSLTGIFNSHLMMAMCVEKYGTDAQKQHYLPRFCTGELRGGVGLTEPDAGTDLQGIRTRAVRDGDHYIINGTKTWITNGIEGNCFSLLVKTDPSADPPRRGMSLFIVEKGPGFTVSRKLEKLGYKGIDSAELVFDNYRVPAANLIGGVEGKGFHQTVGGLELGRINVAARGVGIASRALKESVRYAQQRNIRRSN